MSQLLVNMIYGVFSPDLHQPVKFVVDLFFGLVEFRSIRFEARNIDLVCQIILYRIGQHKVSVRKSLHKRRSAEAVCTMV